MAGYREMAPMHAIGQELRWTSRLFKDELMPRVFFAQEPEMPDETCRGYLVPGIPYNPDAVTVKAWRATRRLGGLGSFGPPLAGEEPSERYGEPGRIVQRFANGILVVDPANGWHASRLPLLPGPEVLAVPDGSQQAKTQQC